MKTDINENTLSQLAESKHLEKSGALLQTARRKFGFVPNLLKTFASSPETLEAYLTVSDLFQNSELNRVEQQVVLIAASVENECEYCVAAHSTVAQGLGISNHTLKAVRASRSIRDPKLEALRRFTVSVVKKRGYVSKEEIDAFQTAGFKERNILDVILGVTQKTLSNYTNHIFHTTLDEAFSRNVWKK